MYIDSSDFGYDCEEVTLPIPTPVTQEYRGGGMDLSVAQPLAALEAMEATVKMAGHNPDILRRMAKGPGQTTRITFRGGCSTSRPAWSRRMSASSKALPMPAVATPGTVARRLEFTVKGIVYFRYDVQDRVVHEVSAWPPR